MAMPLKRGGWPFAQIPPTGMQFGVNYESPLARGLHSWYVPSIAPTKYFVPELVRGANGYAAGDGLSLFELKRDAALGACVYNAEGEYDNWIVCPVGGYPAFGPNQPFTIAAWVYVESQSQYNTVFGAIYTTQNYAVLYPYSAGAQQWGAHLAVSNVGCARLGSTLTAGNFYHLVAAWNPASSGIYRWELYKIGVADGTASGSGGTTMSGTFTASSVQLLNNGAWAEPLYGGVYDVKFWTRTLSASEAQRLYNPDTRHELFRPLWPTFEAEEEEAGLLPWLLPYMRRLRG